MENNINIVKSFCQPDNYYINPIVSRSAIRELSQNAEWAWYENYLHAVRMNILMFGMEYQEALDLVKQIRDRAGLTTATSMDFASEDDIINYILDERQIELVGEGRRWFDLLRTKKWKEVMEPINGMNQDGNELFPIHYSHINENPKLTQNPYYGK